MNTIDYVVTLDALAELAAPFNVKLTRQWVTKYVRLGLLPPQHNPGLGQGKGRRGLYSKALAQQLVPLITAIKQHGKQLDAVGWHLWWYGYYADPKYWHDRLIQTAATWSQVKSSFPNTEASEASNDELIRSVSDELTQRKNAGPLFGAVKRHAADQLQDMFALLMDVLNGSHVPLNSNSQDEYEKDRLEKLFSKTFAIPVTPTEIPEGATHFPTSVIDLDGMLQQVSQFADTNIVSFIASLPAADIHAARAELAPFMFGIAAIEQATVSQTGKSAGARPILWLNKNAERQAAMLVGWLVMRRDPFKRENMAKLSQLIIQQIELTKAALNVA
jgi:hypothetical protein